MYVGLIQNLQPTQSLAQPAPATIVAAATIAPTTRLTNISGTTDIATITPPVASYHELLLNFTDVAPGDILTTGNVTLGITTVTTNRPVCVAYNPTLQKYLVVGA